MKYIWQNTQNLSSVGYKCGFCGKEIASEKGWYATEPNNNHANGHIRICHQCNKPTFFDFNQKQTPGSSFGNDVSDINDSLVNSLYKELRDCMTVFAYTLVVLGARKLLMHIATSKGAEKNKNFIDYVQYLSDNNYIPPDAKDWVDHIRTKGNEANHEIVVMSKNDAEDLVSFIEMLLKLIYEFPKRIKSKSDNGK